MPLVAHSKLPSFSRLLNEGGNVLANKDAIHQDIRELHIGLLNMMPDAALEATERQFFRLIGESNQIAQFYIHPFSIPSLKRNKAGQAHVDDYYENFKEIKEMGLDALIITGANVTQPELSEEPFWQPLIEVIDWAYENVTSTLCSCLATHAVLEFRYKQKRRPLGFKRWGVYPHNVVQRHHPLVTGVNTQFDVPHSRFNQIDRQQFLDSNLHILVESKQADVHLAVSEDQFRLIFFQGHPEYDSISLLKEYKREVLNYFNDTIKQYPPFPENYLSSQAQAILSEYKEQVTVAKKDNQSLPHFPETIIKPQINNTWHDSAEAIINNWLGQVYQLTHLERDKPFQAGIDINNPLNL
ncbi:Homoserine O-succinyltransferase [hydrothermal vent metagenome]|uniref:Homoserine O-succinyltransferase n=1 Tax=hydrothermal vent metagenome TaxID=652676 RepID=A0A3B1A603_9ZZZZ